MHNIYHIHLYKYISGLFVVGVAATTIFLYTHQHEAENNSRKISSKQDSIQEKRLDTMAAVCEKYRHDQTCFTDYVEEPGEKMQGKFTL